MIPLSPKRARQLLAIAGAFGGGFELAPMPLTPPPRPAPSPEVSPPPYVRKPHPVGMRGQPPRKAATAERRRERRARRQAQRKNRSR